MSTSIVMFFGDYDFRSRKSYDDKCGEIRQRMYKKGDLKGEDFKFIHSVLQCLTDFSDSVARGVKRIFVDDARVYGKPSFWFESIDGNKHNFSPARLLQKPKPLQRLKAAARHATLDERREVKAAYFAANESPKCSVTGEALTAEKVDAHHIGRTFESIFRQFVRERLEGIDLKQVVDDHEGFRDKEIEKEWKEYHREHAKLVILSKAEHNEQHRKERR